VEAEEDMLQDWYVIYRRVIWLLGALGVALMLWSLGVHKYLVALGGGLSIGLFGLLEHWWVNIRSGVSEPEKNAE
jgi:hypothetical protein